MANNDASQDKLRYNEITGQLEFGSGNNWTVTGITSSGSGVTNVNAITGAVTIAAGSNITVTPSGHTLTIASTGGTTITNWAAYTPIITGTGTATGVDFRWKQIGDTVYVSGIWISGTPSGTFSISLPNSFTIKYGVGGMSTTQDLVGILVESNSPHVFSGDQAGVIVTDGTTTTTVFPVINGTFTSPFPTGGSSFDASSYLEVNFWFIHA